METLTLKQKLDKLAEISKKLSDPDIELEYALELYTKSVKLAQECQKQINDAKQQIEELAKNDE